MDLYVFINEITEIPTLISKFEDIFNNINNIARVNMYLDFEFCDFIAPEHMAIIVAFVKYLETMGIKIDIEVKNYSNDIDRYLSRIDFYKHLNIPCEENFSRWSSEGRFLEITHFDGNNSIKITNDTIKIIRANCCIEDSVLRCLNYCFFEVADNVDVHANSPIDGYVLAQNYPKKRELKIIFIDAGIGIHESLTKTEGSRYTNLSEEEALKYCIREKTTNGNGMGNGLFHTSEFIKQNQGEMLIYSGNHYININNGNIDICQGPYWQGTIVYLKIYTDNTVELESVFGTEIPETVENMEDYIEGEFSLW